MPRYKVTGRQSRAEALVDIVIEASSLRNRLNRFAEEDIPPELQKDYKEIIETVERVRALAERLEVAELNFLPQLGNLASKTA